MIRTYTTRTHSVAILGYKRISVAGFQFIKVGGPTERLTKIYGACPES